MTIFGMSFVGAGLHFRPHCSPLPPETGVVGGGETPPLRVGFLAVSKVQSRKPAVCDCLTTNTPSVPVEWGIRREGPWVELLQEIWVDVACYEC